MTSLINKKISQYEKKIKTCLDTTNLFFKDQDDKYELRELISRLAEHIVRGDKEIHENVNNLRIAIKKRNFEQVKEYYEKISCLFEGEHHCFESRKTIEQSFNINDIIDIACKNFDKNIIEFLANKLNIELSSLLDFIPKKHLLTFLNFLERKKYKIDFPMALQISDDEEYIKKLIDLGLNLKDPYILSTRVIHSEYSEQDILKKILFLYNHGANSQEQIDILINACIKNLFIKNKPQVPKVEEAFRNLGKPKKIVLDNRNHDTVYHMFKYYDMKEMIPSTVDFIFKFMEDISPNTNLCSLCKSPDKAKSYKLILDEILRLSDYKIEDKSNNLCLEIFRRLFVLDLHKARKHSYVRNNILDKSIFEEFQELFDLQEINL